MLPLELINEVCEYDWCLRGKLTFDKLDKNALLINPHPIVARWILSEPISESDIPTLCHNHNPDVTCEVIKYEPDPVMLCNNPTDIAVDYLVRRGYHSCLSTNSNPRVISSRLENPAGIYWPEFARHTDDMVTEYIMSHWSAIPLSVVLKHPNDKVAKRAIEDLERAHHDERADKFYMHNAFTNGCDRMVRYMLDNIKIGSFYAQFSPDDRIVKIAIDAANDFCPRALAYSKNQMAVSWVCDHPDDQVMPMLSDNPLIFDSTNLRDFLADVL
jgi:hypothetical protein